MSQDEKKKKTPAKGAASPPNDTAPKRKKKEDEDGARYNTMVQSLLDIWNVLAASSEPLTAKEIGDYMQSAAKKNTAPNRHAQAGGWH